MGKDCLIDQDQRFGAAGRDLRQRARARGFTLIELLITLVILGLLASGAVSLWGAVARREKETELRHALREIRGAIDAYKYASDAGRIARPADATGYPPDLNVLVVGVEDIKTPKNSKLYFLRRLPRDPMADSGLTPEQSWGLRSYASDPEAPGPGADVFDVYSQSPGVGLNGVPYAKW